MITQATATVPCNRVRQGSLRWTLAVLAAIEERDNRAAENDAAELAACFPSMNDRSERGWE